MFDGIADALNAAVSEKIHLSPTAFLPVLSKILATATADKKLIDRIADGLSVMDKNAEIQRDKKDEIIYDKESKSKRLFEHITEETSSFRKYAMLIFCFIYQRFSIFIPSNSR